MECPPSLTTVNGAEVCQGKLIFDESFGTLSDNWKKEIKFAGAPVSFICINVNRTSLLFLQGLRIRDLHEPLQKRTHQ